MHRYRRITATRIIVLIMMALIPIFGLTLAVLFINDCGRFPHGEGEMLNWLFGLGKGC